MRIDLVTPFSEKDAAKALGARWDSTKRIWYITDAPDLTPFLRWIPDTKAAQCAASTLDDVVATPKPARASSGVITKPTTPAQPCGCKVLPWEHCEHSVQPGR